MREWNVEDPASLGPKDADETTLLKSMAKGGRPTKKPCQYKNAKKKEEPKFLSFDIKVSLKSTTNRNS